MALFGSKKAKVEVDEVDEAAELDEVAEDDPEADDDADDEWDDEADDDLDDDAPEPDEWVQLDLSRDWRDDGPFDISEVDLEADDVQRIDLGALIVTPERGFTIQVAADAQTQIATQVVVSNAPQSAMQLTLFAAPSDEDFRADIRQDMIDQSSQARSVELVEGPFGTEIRRVLPVTDASGREGTVPMRDWLVAGPRWVLNARLMGAAALGNKGKTLAVGLEEFFRNIVVRRDDTAMVPGTAVPLTLPTKP